MANEKFLLDLDELSTRANGDALLITDISDNTHDDSGTSKYITVSNLLSGLAESGNNTDISSVLLDQSGLFIKGDDDNALKIKCHELLTGTRTLRLVVNDSTRTLDLGGNLTVSSSATISNTNTGDQTFSSNEIPSGVVDGSNAVFTVAYTPVNSSLKVIRNGLLQNEGAGNDYTVSGSVITFTAAPLSGDIIKCNYEY